MEHKVTQFIKEHHLPNLLLGFHVKYVNLQGCNVFGFLGEVMGLV